MKTFFGMLIIMSISQFVGHLYIDDSQLRFWVHLNCCIVCLVSFVFGLFMANE